MLRIYLFSRVFQLQHDYISLMTLFVFKHLSFQDSTYLNGLFLHSNGTWRVKIYSCLEVWGIQTQYDPIHHNYSICFLSLSVSSSILLLYLHLLNQCRLYRQLIMKAFTQPFSFRLQVKMLIIELKLLRPLIFVLLCSQRIFQHAFCGLLKHHHYLMKTHKF